MCASAWTNLETGISITMTRSHVHLLDIEPDLGAFLTDQERDVARTLAVPVRGISPGPLELEELFKESHAFAALLLTGMVTRSLAVGVRSALTLLGPGDLMTLSGTSQTELLSMRHEARADTEVALLGDHLLVAARRFPRLMAGIAVRMGEQHDRLAAQLVICQMPRVEDRIVALMWLLAETWGRVTGSGTAVPLMLTHDTIGELVGARRPTVTLALAHLAEEGRLIRQDRGWLLLEAADAPTGNGSNRSVGPGLIATAPSGWEVGTAASTLGVDHEAISDTIRSLREGQAVSAERVRAGLERAALSRERSLTLRRRIRERRRDRPTPS
jgi:CRP/FNR family transcriptional regulator, cyclic AMP receptor protein